MKSLIIMAILCIFNWPRNGANTKIVEKILDSIGMGLPFGYPFLVNHLRRMHSEKAFGSLTDAEKGVFVFNAVPDADDAV